MPRYTLISWTCNLPCGLSHPANIRICPSCGTNHYPRYANVRASERAVVDISPDGSISVPGRNDIPLHPKQIAHGVRRVEVTSAIGSGTNGGHSLKRLERAGLVHEASTWNSEGGMMPMKVEEIYERKPKSVDQILAEPEAF